MPKSVFERAKAMLVFRPEDPTNLWQMPPRFETGSTVERIKGYRYPAPGSQHASVPVRDSEDTVYDIKNFTRHPSHMPLNVRATTHIYIYIYVGLLDSSFSHLFSFGRANFLPSTLSLYSFLFPLSTNNRTRP